MKPLNRADTTILIIDDEELYRWNLTFFIEDEGYKVVSVESSEKALDLLVSGKQAPK